MSIYEIIILIAAAVAIVVVYFQCKNNDIPLLSLSGNFVEAPNEEKKRKNTGVDEEEIERIRNEFNSDAETMRYRVRDGKFLDILLYSKNIPFLQTFHFSKDRGILVLGNGAFSLNSFVIGVKEKKSSSLSYNNGIFISEETTDDTDYKTLNILSESMSVSLCSYTFDNEFFKRNFKELEDPYWRVKNTFSKIFNDAVGNFCFEEVRASENDIIIMDNLLSDSKES